MSVRRNSAALAVALAWASCLAAPGAAQGFRLRVGASAVGALTRAAPLPFDRTLTEARVVSPMLMANLDAGRRFSLHAMVNLEGWTIPGGVLAPGGWGEGFNDRRHPHTFVHELMASAAGPSIGPVRTSLSVGKGFAPFGTDDPGNRPVLGFPVNHHWSQVLERAVAIAGIAVGPVVAEFGVFNGDEPEGPSSWPRLDGRFGDSWAARLLVHPASGVELQGSRALVKSPEHRWPAAGPTHYKWSASARLDRPVRNGTLYAMAEWARNSELDGFFVHHSLLVEAEWRHGPHRPYLRLERTERPEEERLLDPFRSIRPHFENSNLGTSRWSVATAGYGRTLLNAERRFNLEPFAELSLAHVSMVTGGAVFTPEGFFGGNDLVTVNVGLRVRAGAPMHRMGRYGVLAEPHESMRGPMPTNPNHGHHE